MARWVAIKPKTESGITKGVQSSSSPPPKSGLMASPKREVLLNVETSLYDPERWKVRAAAMLIEATLSRLPKARWAVRSV